MCRSHKQLLLDYVHNQTVLQKQIIQLKFQNCVILYKKLKLIFPLHWITSFNQKPKLESQRAEVGPIKYIAELVYGNTERNTIDDAVRWLIIVFIFVFDPLAVLLLIAANYSFKNRNDNDSSQEEIFDALFAKKDKKKLDIASNIDDTGVEETKEDITRKLNTSLVKRHGWLDKK